MPVILRQLAQLPRVGCVLLLIFLGCDGRSATEPRPSALLVAYEEPASLPPAGDPGCTHHNGTAFLVVATDWGATGRLLPRDGNVHSLALDAPSPGDHWLSVSDYRYCSTGCPIATSGLSVNGLPLVRIAPSAGESCSVVWFRVSSNGTVSP